MDAKENVMSKRSELMKRYIADCVENLLVTNSIERISIKDIIETAGISKATFYRYFLDKYDALNWIYVQEIEKNRDRYPVIFDQSYHNLSFLQSRKDFQKAMLVTAQNSLHDHVTDVSYLQHLELAKAYYAPSSIPPEVESAVFLYAIGSFELTMQWLRSGAKEDASSVIKAQKTAASALLLEIFSVDASTAAVRKREAAGRAS